MQKLLKDRHQNLCELCGLEGVVATFSPFENATANNTVAICAVCDENIKENFANTNHWRCLNESIWSEHDAVKMIAYRILKQLNEPWANEILEMAYLEDDLIAEATKGLATENAIQHKDSNGTILLEGDTITLIKDLDVKGANFTAKRGTTVKNIRLDPDNETYIEGKVSGQQIVILTQFVKKG